MNFTSGKKNETSVVTKRVITGLTSLLVILVVIKLGNPLFLFFITILAILGALEIYRMSFHSEHHYLTIIGTLFTALIIIIPYYVTSTEISLLLILSIAALLVPLLSIIICSQKNNLFSHWVWTIIPIFYLGWALQHYVLLIDYPSGKQWILIAMLPTFACDTAAYFVGKSRGKHKLAPSVSPNKTWEGAIAGFCAAVGTTILLAFIFHRSSSMPLLGYGTAAILGCLTGIFAQLGDLLCSRIKRINRVKDSGTILPGHGGILDRIGSMIFTGLIIYYYVSWNIH